MSGAPDELPKAAPMQASILLVDDQPANLLALEALLDPLGQRLVLARSGKEALKRLLSESFAVILLDMRMPDMDGFETASLIRQRERTRGTPLIFLTANDWSESEINNAYQLGAVDFLTKPLNAHIVRSKVAVFVDLYLRGEMIKAHEAELRMRAVEHAAHVEGEAQRARIYSLFMQAPAAIAMLRGPNHVFEFVNTRYLQMTGNRGLVGQPVAQVLPDLAEQPFYAALSQVYASGEPLSVSAAPARLYRDASGAMADGFFNVTYQPTRDRAGAVDGVLIHAVEVTEQVLAAEALRRSEAKFRQVAESGMIGLLFADLDGSISDANDAFLAMLGYTHEDLMNAKVKWNEITPPEWGPADEKAIEELLATGVARPFEKEYIRKDGSRLPIVFGAAMLDESKSKLVAFVLDNTRRKRAEGEQQRLIQSLARSNEELDQFAYIASHDLKAPLRGIASLSEWLEEDLDTTITEAAREKLNLIRGRVHRMEALINGILDYSRIGRVRHQTRRIDVRKLVGDVIELLAPREGAVIEIEPEMPVVRAEQVLLQQVFLNLIGNALKHARRSDPHVRVGVRDAGSFHEFIVTDNGQGIAPEYHEKIWTIFQTLEARDKVEGTGIGLSLVKKIVELRGGRAWVESSQGAGAAFHFTWPKDELTERS